MRLFRHNYAGSLPGSRLARPESSGLLFLGVTESKACGFFRNLPTHLPAHMLKAMGALSILISFALSSAVAVGQVSTTAPEFDVASVKPSQHLVGPDYNNQLSYSPNGIIARNVTLKCLVAEAYQLQLNQVLG